MPDSSKHPIRAELPQTLVRATPERNGTVGVAGLDRPPGGSVLVTTMSVWALIGIRVLRVYLQTFLGLLGADGVGAIDLGAVPTFGAQWGKLATVLFAATAPAFVSLCMNALEFLTDLDTKAPKMRG